MVTIRHDSFQKTIQDLVNLYENGQLNLSPGFQRASVWTERDRVKLIDSIVRNYPIPAIFLYRRSVEGEIVYDVIDGKQRLESVLMFMDYIRGKSYDASILLPGEDEKQWVNWRSLCKIKQQGLLTGYCIRTIEVDGSPADIIDLFVRINSTGKALTAAEKRHAKYFNSYFLKEAGKLASYFESYFRDQNILSAGQISRMKHIELACELMISIYQGDVINKKATIDKVMRTDTFTERQVQIAKQKTVMAINRVRRMFPKLYQTRFSQMSDYYSLVVLVAKFESENLILTDAKRNGRAWELLVAFSSGVDEAREHQKKAIALSSGQESCRDYLLTVTQSTDEIVQRRNREQVLRGILQSLFERKDSERLFSLEQRRILWHSNSERRCAKCKKPITWVDLTIDHIRPYSKGGRRTLENAALMHRSCNASKGNR